MKYRKLWLGLAVVLGSSFTAARADWKNAIPANAGAVLIVRDVKTVETNVRAFAENIGQPLPPFIQLEPLAQSVGLGSWQMDEGAALVVMAPSPEGVVLIVPVRDEMKALVDINAKPAGEFHTAQVAGSPPLTILAKPSLFIVGLTPASLQPFQAAAEPISGKWTKDESKLLGESSVFLWANGAYWRPMLPALFQQAEQQMYANLPQDDPKEAAKQQAFLQWYTSFYRNVLEQTASAAIALRVDGEFGVVQSEWTFESGSYYHGIASAIPTPDSNLLSGLPGGPFVFAQAGDVRGLRKPFEDALASLLALPSLKDEPIPAPWDGIIKQAAAVGRNLEGYNAVLNMTDNGISVFGHVKTHDAEGAADWLKQVFHAIHEERSKEGKPELTLDPVSKKVGGKTVRQVSFPIDNAPENERESRRIVLGPKPRLQWQATDGMLTFAFASHLDPLDLLKNSAGSLADETVVKTTLSVLPEKPALVWFMEPSGFGRFFSTTSRAARAEKIAQGVAPNSQAGDFGPPAPNTPMVSAGLAPHSSGVSYRIVVPAAFIRYIVAEIKKSETELPAPPAAPAVPPPPAPQ